jgi:hypothetical protein
MKIIHIPKTEKTPEITLDDTLQVFQVEGNCLPENIRELSQQVIKELEQYLRTFEKKKDNDKPFRVNFRLGYFNTAAAKFIADIIMLVFSYMQKGINIKIYWYYYEDDHDMLEAGEEMAEMVNVPMNFVMVVKD